RFLGGGGGGGWVPVGTPTLLASGRMEPRKVVGSVDTGEFLVALGASIGFLISLSWRQVPVTRVLLLPGGGPAAPPPAPRLGRHRLPDRPQRASGPGHAGAAAAGRRPGRRPSGRLAGQAAGPPQARG